MLGIYYLTYTSRLFVRSEYKLIIGYTRADLLESIAKKEVPEEYQCWIEECRTPGRFFQGTMKDMKVWIERHMPDAYGEPLVDRDDNNSPTRKL